MMNTSWKLQVECFGYYVFEVRLFCHSWRFFSWLENSFNVGYISTEDCQRQIKGRETVATMLDDIRRTYNRNGHIQERANAIFKLAKITPPG